MPQEKSIINETIRTIAKGVVYALCFWLIYKSLNLLTQPPSTNTSTQQQDQAFRDYADQQRRSNQMLDETEKQQKRTSDVIARSEENAKRMTLLLDSLEAKIKK